MGKASKKSTTASASLDSNEVIVLKYLQTQNRPYSATDIFNNLHKQVGKTAVTKALNSLVEKGEVSEKAYGKQQVFVIRQDSLPTPSPKELAILDNELQQLHEALASQKEKTKLLQSQLADLQGSLSNEELERTIGKLQKERESADIRLASLRSGARSVNPLEKVKVDSNLDLYTKEWRSRKRSCVDVINSITENAPQSPAALMEELGMELDPLPADK